MSAGEFVNTTYQAQYDTAEFHPIRVQPETLAFTADATNNAAPTDAQTSPIPANSGGNKRSQGLRARFVTVKYAPPNIPTGYDARGGTLKVPIMTQGLYDAITKDSVITYLSTTMTFVSKTRESLGLGGEN